MYKADLLKWQKAIFEKCNDGNGIVCVKAWEIRDATTLSKKLDGYYSKSAEDREAWDLANEDKVTALKS